jgi:hypothetical protein
MNNKFRRSAIVRQIRWLLIKNGLGEDEADAAIEKLHSDLTSNVINENDRLTILREIANRASKLRPGDVILSGVVGNAIYDALKLLVSKFAGILDPPHTTPAPTAKAPVPPTASPAGTSRQYLEGVIEDTIIDRLRFVDRDLLIFLAVTGWNSPPNQSSMLAVGGCATNGQVYRGVKRSWGVLKQRLGVWGAWDVVDYMPRLTEAQKHLLIEYFRANRNLYRFGETFLPKSMSPPDIGLLVDGASSTVGMRFQRLRLHRAEWIIEYSDRLCFELMTSAHGVRYPGPTDAGYGMSFMRKGHGEAGLEIASLVTCVLAEVQQETSNGRSGHGDLMRSILADGIHVPRPLQSPNR